MREREDLCFCDDCFRGLKLVLCCLWRLQIKGEKLHLKTCFSWLTIAVIKTEDAAGYMQRVKMKLC